MIRSSTSRFRALSLLTAISIAAAAFVVAINPTHALAEGRGSELAGSAKVGSASYPAPANAVYAAPWGSDAASGSAGAPVKTLARAVALAPASGTVVLRGGSYHEYLVVSKTVTIQNAPGEEVWLDGSSPVTGWVQDGSRWRHDGWTTRFDHSPTYTKGAPDSTNPYWQFVNPQLAPMAAHPDQVWINGARQEQKKSLDLVGAGGFFLDETTSKLYVGSDPNNKEVRASTLAQALSVRAPGVVVRGIGFQRYAPSVWMLGALVFEQPNPTLENIVVSEMSTTGVSVLASGARVNNVTVEWCGMLGFHNRFADNISYYRVRSTHNNAEHFNVAPVSGGIKIGQTRGVTVTESAFVDNFGHGFWTDMSVYNTVVRGSDFSRNSGDGLFLEISARAIVVDSMFVGNQLDGIKVNNVSNAKIWNNTFIGNSRPIWLAQDARRNTSRSDPAVDPRVPWPDPEMPWKLQDINVMNNVVGLPLGATNCLLCVEDYSHQDTAEGMRIVTNGNVYDRSSATNPQWLTIWSRGSANPAVFSTLSAFRSGTGQEARSREYVGAVVVSPTGVLDPNVQSSANQIALPLPSDIAAQAAQPVGVLHLGAWTDTNSGAVPPPPPPTTPTLPLPASGALVGQDTYSRTVSSGWGAADLGGAWTIPAGTTQFSTSNGGGRMILNRGDGFEARLDSLRMTTSDVRVATSFDSLPDDVGLYNAVIGRSLGATGDYRLKTRVMADGSVTAWLVRRSGAVETVLSSSAEPGLKITVGKAMLARIRVTGTAPTTIDAKVWSGGTAEPASWALSAKDATTNLQNAGSPGLYAYSHGSSTGQPVAVYWDALEVRNS